MTTFKPGDKVRVVKPLGISLYEGRELTVRCKEGLYLYLYEIIGGWDPNRFDLVKEPKVAKNRESLEDFKKKVQDLVVEMQEKERINGLPICDKVWTKWVTPRLGIEKPVKPTVTTIEVWWDYEAVEFEPGTFKNVLTSDNEFAGIDHVTVVDHKEA